MVTRYFDKSRFSPQPTPLLTLEVTNICRSSCVYCPNQSIQIHRQCMDMEIFKKAVDQFVDMGGININFNSCIGEPLLDPLLLERKKYLDRYPQLKFEGLFTTLQWMHNFDLDEFFELGKSTLSISIAFSGREKYREFFGVDYYEQTLNNMVTLLKENKKRGNVIKIDYILVPTNEPAEQVMEHPDFQMVNELSEGVLAKAFAGRKAFVDDWSGVVNIPSYLKKRPLFPKAFAPCQLLFYRMIVFCDGKIGACPRRDYKKELVLGDIRNDSLRDAWGGQRLAEIRSHWRRRNIIPDPCRRCSRYEYS